MATLHPRACALAIACSLAACASTEALPDASMLSDAGADAPAASDAFVADPFPSACENVNALHCLAPWPSSRYLVDDPSTRTGYRIELPREAMPANLRNIRVDPRQWNVLDGFSPATSMMTVVSVPLDTSLLPDERHIEDSLAADSPTVILEVPEGGAPVRIAHYAEIDTWPNVDPALTPLYVRPAARLRERTRYVVAIRGLRASDGAPVEPSPWFRAVRDGIPLSEAEDLEGRRASFEEIFEILAAAGVARSSLIEAWDFRTASDERLVEDLLVMRDESIRRNETPGECRITVTEIEEAPRALVHRRLRGTVRVPLFLNGTEPGGETVESIELSRIHRDAMGRPTQNEEIPFAEVPFVATIPDSVRARVAAGGEPARVMAYGHGLFGTRASSESGSLAEMLDELVMIAVAVDWWGMSEDDVLRVTRSLGEFSSFDATSERLAQGLTNFQILTHSLRLAGEGRCEIVGTAEVPAPFSVTPTSGGEPALLYDPDAQYYYGDSQGGIMGMSLAALSVDVTRLVLGVGGMSYSTMIPRSSNWQGYGAVMQNSYRRQVDRALLMTMAQSQWDLAEPSSLVPYVRGPTLPCTLGETRCPGGVTPEHHVFMMIAEDDAQVPNVSSDTAARSMGIPLLTPSPYVPWGLATTTGSTDTEDVLDAMVVFAIPGVPALPLGTRDPGMDNPAHGGPRRSPATRRMMDPFFRPDGRVVFGCTDVCDPE